MSAVFWSRVQSHFSYFCSSGVKYYYLHQNHDTKLILTYAQTVDTIVYMAWVKADPLVVFYLNVGSRTLHFACKRKCCIVSFYHTFTYSKVAWCLLLYEIIAIYRLTREMHFDVSACRVSLIKRNHYCTLSAIMTWNLKICNKLSNIVCVERQNAAYQNRCGCCNLTNIIFSFYLSVKCHFCRKKLPFNQNNFWCCKLCSIVTVSQKEFKKY